MLALVTALVQAALAWLQIRAVSARYDLTRRIEADIQNDENAIADLRALGDDAAQLAADRLRDRILRAQGIVAALPTPRPEIARGPTGTDGSGDVRPANG